MPPMPPVFVPEDVGEWTVEDMRDASATYHRSFGLTEAFNRCRSDPHRRAFLEGLNKGG